MDPWIRRGGVALCFVNEMGGPTKNNNCHMYIYIIYIYIYICIIYIYIYVCVCVCVTYVVLLIVMFGVYNAPSLWTHPSGRPCLA